MAETKDPSPKSKPFTGKAAAVVGMLVSGLFLLNLTFGVIEVPDNLPLVGNLDEVAAAGLLFSCLRYLGFDVLPFGRRDDDDDD